MSDADWIEKLVQAWGGQTRTKNEQAAFRNLVLKHYAAHLATLDVSGIAERIADLIFAARSSRDGREIEEIKKDVTAALAPLSEQLASYRRTDAKLAEMLVNDDSLTFVALEIVNGKFEAVVYTADTEREIEVHADSPLAALAALAGEI